MKKQRESYLISIGGGDGSKYKRSPTMYAYVTRRFSDTIRFTTCDYYLELDSSLGTCDRGLFTCDLNSIFATCS